MTLFINIGELAGIAPEGLLRKQGAEMADAGILRNAWLAEMDGRIVDYGSMASCPGAENVVDVAGGMILPAFCDSHTHLVYAGSRDAEFLDKLSGLSYEQIAARGGGILNSSDLLNSTSEDELLRQSMPRVLELMAKGTGSMEIKSGYGLNPEGEMKMLRVIRRIKESVRAQVRSTFLGAHAVGRGYGHADYVQAVIDMMPEAAGLADYVDVFCDEGFFTPEDTARILEAGAAHGLRGKIHANELAVSGGVQVGVKYGALSVDHLERTTDAEIEVLKGSGTMPVMLPGTSFFLGIPYGRAKDYIRAGLGIALASDYNPGSSPSGDMRFVMALGCIRMGLTPAEAFNAVTINGAYAMGLSGITGSITRGKRADLILTDPGWTQTKLPYLHHSPFIRSVYLAGELLP
ncbi:MAG: imidazolonepropionase [Bacteroidales bacterium]|nr:imidazolonepropionase [Bacteroidales bacterium]